MEYVQMHKGSGFRRFFFDHGLISMNFPQLRPKIEYKIIQDFFIQSYNLPVEFKFANYMCGVLKDHILALVEIRPIAWLTLATFVALNYIRIAFVDPVYQSEVCERYPSKNHHLSDPKEEENGSQGNVTSHVAHAFLNHFLRPARNDEEYTRRLAGGSSSSEEHHGPSRYHVCEEYTLRYVFVCSAMLMCYIVGLTFASEVYMQRLVDKVLDTELAIQLKEEEQELNRDADHGAHGALPAINEDKNEKEEKGAEEDDDDDSEADSVVDDLTKQNTLNNSVVATPPNNPPSTPHNTPPNGMIGTVSAAVSVTLAAAPVSPRVVPKRGAIRKSGSYTSGQTLDLSSISSLNTVNAINALSAVSFDGPGGDATPSVVPCRGMLSAKFRAQSYSASLQEKGPSPAVSLLPRLGSNEAMPPSEKRRFSLTRQNSVASSRASFGSMEGGVGLRGLIFGENRRYLYLHCLERIMQKDFKMRQREGELHREPSVRHDYRLTSSLSRQTSTTMKSKSGGEGQIGAAVGVSLTRATSSRKNPLQEESAEMGDAPVIDEESPAPVVSPSRPASTTTGDVDRIDFRAYRNLRHEYRLRRQGSLTTQQNIPAAGESQELPGDEVQTRQRGLTAYARETLKAFGASFASSSNNHSIVTSHTGDNCYHAPDDIEYGRPGSGRWHLFKTRSRRHSESSTSTGPAHTSTGHGHGHGHPNSPIPIRNRGYSVQYFSIEKPVGEGSVGSVEKIDRIKKFREMLKYLANVTFSFLHQVWKTIVGHHLGISSGAVRQDDDIKELETEFQEIFLFHNPELYYFAIEFGLLVQYVYVALWATNFIFLADLSYHRVLWEFALVVPMVINFFFLKQIIFTSVMLKSIVKLDQRIANEICERATDERVVTQRLKHLLRTNLKTMAIDRKEWYNHCYGEYQTVLAEGQRGLDVSQLKRFLHALQIYLTDDSIRRIFQVLDTDKDHSVHWERLSQILLPEYYKRKIRLLKKKIVTSSKKSKHVEEDHEEGVDGGTSKKKKNKPVKRASITYEYHITESQESKNDEVVGRKSSVLKAVTNLNPFNSHHTVISGGKGHENNSVSEKNGADSHGNGISATRRHSFNIVPAHGLTHASSEGTAGNTKRQTKSTDDHDGKGQNDQESISAPRQHSFNVFSKSTIGAGLAAIRGSGGNMKASASTSTTTPHNNRASLPHVTAAAKLFGVEDVISSNSNSANNSARYSITGGREELRDIGTERADPHHHYHSGQHHHSDTSSDNDGHRDQSDSRALARARRHSQHYSHSVEHNQLIDLIASKHASKHMKSQGDGDIELVAEDGRENEDCDSNHSDGHHSHYSEASSSELSQFTDDRSIASDESDFSHTSQDIRYHDIYVEDQCMQDSDRSKVYSLRPPVSPISKSPSQTIRRGVSINKTKDLTKSNDVTIMHQSRIDTTLSSAGDHVVTDTQSAVMMSLEEEERQDGGGVVVFDKSLPTTKHHNQESIHSNVNTSGKQGVKSRFVDV
eukprot:scaffold256_cov175-Ochromonas_danica.AAC.9